MEVSKAAKMIGTIVTVRFEQVEVRCKVVDLKSAYGRVDFKITPVNGAGGQWVSETRIQESEA